MAGHSKWAQIKRKKAVVDAQRGKLFSKLTKNIELAAQKGVDPATNAALRIAIDAARAANMPRTTIDRAIQKGEGGSRTGQVLESVYYEAYGPEGVGLLIKAITDNRRRTSAELRHILQKNGATPAEAGSVQWLFKEKAVFYFPKDAIHTEQVEELAMRTGADDVSEEGNEVLLIGEAKDFDRLRTALINEGLLPREGRLEWLPATTVPLSETAQSSLANIIEKLEENEDIQEIFSNAA